MSDCIHEEVCGTCDVEPEWCAYYEKAKGKCMMERIPECSYDDLQCSECGCALWGFQIDMAGEGVITKPRFCPWCGREVEQ